MNKLILTVFPIFMLTACAQTKMASLLAIHGLEFSYSETGDELIEKYTVTKNVLGDNISQLHSCVASEINNKSVSLNDGAAEFAGPYWRYSYGVGNTFSVAGGETVKYSDKNSIVVNGVTDYATSTDRRYVRYSARISREGNNIRYVFSDIEQAQQHSAPVANRGFYRVTTWRDAAPDKAIAALDKEVEKVQNCLISAQGNRNRP